LVCFETFIDKRQELKINNLELELRMNHVSVVVGIINNLGSSLIIFGGYDLNEYKAAIIKVVELGYDFI
jgi:hypothetical protein